MQTTVKRLIPLPIKKAIVQSSTYYKVRYAWVRRQITTSAQVGSTSALTTKELENVLPNNGPIPLKQSYASAQTIVESFPDASRRRQDITGFDGFAADDAIFDPVTQQSEMWSYAPLAAYIAKLAYARYPQPTLLELGCGPAHLFHFYRDLGLRDYIGIDGHPLFLKMNPYLAGHEQHFLCLNLQEEIQLQRRGRPMKFDAIYSFEVFEHIREDKIDELIKTIRNHMHERSLFVGTASRQANIDVHVLVKGRDWWLAKFAQHGLVPCIGEARLIRQIGENHPFNWSPTVSNIFALEVHT